MGGILKKIPPYGAFHTGSINDAKKTWPFISTKNTKRDLAIKSKWPRYHIQISTYSMIYFKKWWSNPEKILNQKTVIKSGIVFNMAAEDSPFIDVLPHHGDLLER